MGVIFALACVQRAVCRVFSGRTASAWDSTFGFSIDPLIKALHLKKPNPPYFITYPPSVNGTGLLPTLLCVGKLNITNYRLLQNKAPGSTKHCRMVPWEFPGPYLSAG